MDSKAPGAGDGDNMDAAASRAVPASADVVQLPVDTDGVVLLLDDDSDSGTAGLSFSAAPVNATAASAAGPSVKAGKAKRIRTWEASSRPFPRCVSEISSALPAQNKHPVVRLHSADKTADDASASCSPPAWDVVILDEAHKIKKCVRAPLEHRLFTIDS